LTLAAIAGLFSDLLAGSMMTPKGINWLSFYTQPPFYVLLAAVGLTILYQRHVFGVDREILKFSDTEFCTAYARSQLIPAQVAAAVKRIESGDTDSFARALAEIKRATKK
jgi:hypothetical protein